MIGMGSGDYQITLSFDPASLKPGDVVSYRVPDDFVNNPLGTITVDVQEQTFFITHYGDVSANPQRMVATRTSRPVLKSSELDK